MASIKSFITYRRHSCRPESLLFNCIADIPVGPSRVLLICIADIPVGPSRVLLNCIADIPVGRSHLSFNWVFEWRRLRIPQNVPRKPHPSCLVASHMKFKLHGRANRAAENPEEVECFQFDPSQIAVMCFSHTSSTFVLLENGL
jgi:hypothetical protein